MNIDNEGLGGDDDTPDELEVEIEDDAAEGADAGDGKDGAEVEIEGGKGGGKKTGSQRAIDRKTKEASEHEQTSKNALDAFNRERNANAEMQRKNAELAKRMRESDEKRHGATDYALDQAKAAASAKAELAKRDLETAITAGDAAKQADAQARLSKATGDLSNAESWEATEKVRRENAKKEAEEEAKAPPRIREDQFTIGQWQAQNDWANPASDNYDDEAFSHVENFGRKLNSALQAQGRGGEILTQAYWARVNKEYLDFTKRKDGAGDGRRAGGNGDGRNRIPNMRAGGEVAGVGAEGAQPGSQGGKKSVKLTPTELAMCERYVGVMNKADGTPLTKNEIIQDFAKKKLARLDSEGRSSNRRSA